MTVTQPPALEQPVRTALAPAFLAPAAPQPPVRPAHVLDVSVADLRVPIVGGVLARPGHDLPLVVVDPTGQEVVWVTRALRALQGEGLSNATLKAYAKSFLRAARPMWALRCDPATIDVLEYAVVRNWLRLGQRTNSRTKGDARRPLSGSTLVGTEAALATIYGAARRAGLVAVDPVQALRGQPDDRFDSIGFVTFDTPRRRNGGGRAIAKVVDKQVVVLEPGDRCALRNSPQPRNRALWTLCLDSGPRISEALSLTPATYEQYANRGYVIAKGLGGVARRVIPISDESVHAINDYMRWLTDHGVTLGPDDPIFRSLQSPYDPMTYDSAWKALRRALCRTDVHPHALRHTAATELLDLIDGTPGQRLERIRIVLGHKNLATTQKYLHVTEAEAIASHVAARRQPLRAANPVLRQIYTAAEMTLLAAIRKDHSA